MFYELTAKKRNGDIYSFAELEGKVALIVNTATGCGFTPQYEGLEKLYLAYHEKGFEILDFPCNQFGHQAPGTDDEIHEFCTAKYKTSFDQFAKIEVNGENESPVYTYLKSQSPTETIQGMRNKITMKAIAKISTTVKKPGDIHWNFTKFLVDKKGNVVRRYDPTYPPEKIESDVVALLEEKV